MNRFMCLAITESKKAKIKDEVPVGCVIVRKNKVLVKAYNKKEKTKVTTRHAEIIAIEKACEKIGDWRLDDCEIYVTLEPCMMCKGAIEESRIKKVYYGLNKNKKIVSKTKYIIDNEMTDECKNIICDFFRKKRNKCK